MLNLNYDLPIWVEPARVAALTLDLNWGANTCL